jgi:hypothetical protein
MLLQVYEKQDKHTHLTHRPSFASAESPASLRDSDGSTDEELTK